MITRRGSVLILALWSLFFLGALALAVAGYVSAAIDTARFLKNESRAYYVARAGVDYAVAMVLTNTSDFVNEPDAFEDQAVGEMGSFSVTHMVMSNRNDKSWGAYTNFGIGAYGINDGYLERINVDQEFNHAETRAQLEGLDFSTTTINSILSYDPKASRKETVDNPGGRKYGSHFGSVQELMAVMGVGWTDYVRLEPLVTIERFKRLQKDGQRSLALYSYGGTSEGRIEIEREDGTREIVASSHIIFVFSVTNGAERVEFLHWRDY